VSSNHEFKQLIRGNYDVQEVSQPKKGQKLRINNKHETKGSTNPTRNSLPKVKKYIISDTCKS